jgi:hypothetical protein
LRKIWLLGFDQVGAAVCAPKVPVRSQQLQPYADRLGELIRRFNVEVDRTLIRYREEFLERQYAQERIARAAMELFACACVLSRWDASLQSGNAEATGKGLPPSAAELFLRGSYRRARRSWRKCTTTTTTPSPPRLIDTAARRQFSHVMAPSLLRMNCPMRQISDLRACDVKQMAQNHLTCG